MIHLELQPELEAQLAAQSEACGLPIENLIQNIVAERLTNANLLDQADTLEGIRRGLADEAAGRTYPAHEVFAELDREYGLQG